MNTRDPFSWEGTHFSLSKKQVLLFCYPKQLLPAIEIRFQHWLWISITLVNRKFTVGIFENRSYLCQKFLSTLFKRNQYNYNLCDGISIPLTNFVNNNSSYRCSVNIRLDVFCNRTTKVIGKWELKRVPYEVLETFHVTRSVELIGNFILVSR